MAWLDDRYWCHPKIVALTDGAYRAHTNAITYSSGMSTAGILDVSQQRMIGARPKHRAELVKSGLWDDLGAGTVRIHDWDEHNGKRDERRRKDRERKRDQRRTSAGQSTGQRADSPQDNQGGRPQDTPRKHRGQNVGPAHVDGSEGSDGSDGTTRTTPKAVTSHDNRTAQDITHIKNHLHDALELRETA